MRMMMTVEIEFLILIITLVDRRQLSDFLWLLRPPACPPQPSRMWQHIKFNEYCVAWQSMSSSRGIVKTSPCHHKITFFKLLKDENWTKHHLWQVHDNALDNLGHRGLAPDQPLVLVQAPRWTEALWDGEKNYNDDLWLHLFLNKISQLFETLVPLAWISINKPFRKFCLHNIR